LRIKRLLILLGAIILIQIISIFPQAYLQEEYTPNELILDVYSDGFVDLMYKVDVDPTLFSVNISLFGGSYENLITKDQDGILLDYMIFDGYVRIDVLGSQSVDIEYSASDLTDKTGSLWILNFTSPVNTNIQLPQRATIISLSPTPLGISIIEDKAIITMPSGQIEITYILGVVGTKEHALSLINEAEGIINEKITEGIEVSEAESLLQLAKEEYNQGQYLQAEQYAEQAKASAMEAALKASEASTALEEAQSAIDAAEEAGKTSLLDEAKEEFAQAQALYDNGNYTGAKYHAEQSESTAQDSERKTSNLTIYIVGTVGVATLVGLVLISKKNGKIQEPDSSISPDLEGIFSENPHLRFDEREVLKFIAEARAGVFVSELRKRFDIPKSSAWRMIRRLEDNSIIVTESVGRETFVKIKQKMHN
jgi:uncharacterized membrane protein